MRYIDSPKCKCTEVYEPEHKYTFSGPCRVTGETHSVTIAAKNLFDFRQTDDIMTTGLNADDREFVMSGISPKGWEQLFSEE